MASADDVIERLGAGLDEGEIPLRIYNDEAVYDVEMERIFARTWQYVGHMTEIPDPGDYVRRWIAGDPYIFVRDEAGEVQVLLDACRHRGAKLCRADKGNTSSFRCPYHGWTYKTTGELVGVPKREEAFTGLDVEEWGLKSPPRVDSYDGLVFASLASEGPSLEAYLGDMRWYLDLHCRLTEGGLEVIGEPNRQIFRGNWKVAAENNSGDPYHVQITHRSFNEAGIRPREEREKSTYYVNDVSGHHLVVGIDEDRPTYYGLPEDLVDAHLNEGGLTDEQLRYAAHGVMHVGHVFPNLTFSAHIAKPSDEPAATFFDLRLYRPLGPDRTEQWTWILAPAEASAAQREAAYRAGLSWTGPSGNSDQDDIAIWEGITENAGGYAAERTRFSLNYTMGFPEMSRVETREDWLGPGTAYSTLTDANLRGVLRTWYEHVSAAEPPRPTAASTRGEPRGQ